MRFAFSQQWAASIRATAERHPHGRHAVTVPGRAERGMVLLG